MLPDVGGGVPVAVLPQLVQHLFPGRGVDLPSAAIVTQPGQVGGGDGDLPEVVPAGGHQPEDFGEDQVGCLPGVGGQAQAASK